MSVNTCNVKWTNVRLDKNVQMQFTDLVIFSLQPSKLRAAIIIPTYRVT